MHALVFPLDAIRTDGWLERTFADIANFDALCELIGERTFGFSMILGVRITTLTVNEQAPEQTIVEFVVEDGSQPVVVPQRLSLRDFRQRLVSALLEREAPAEPPTSEDDLEGIKRFIGIRYLLLAPLYGYTLIELALGDSQAMLTVDCGGEEEIFRLEAFRETIRGHLMEELGDSAQDQGEAIDLAHVALAEQAADVGDWPRILNLLRGWPAPLATFLRTVEGQSLAAEARALVAKGLGLLGTACVRLGEVSQGEDIFRLAVQFASHGQAGAEVFRRLGESMLDDGRPGEAIAPLRRALTLGGDPRVLYPLLAQAFVERGKYVAALACVEVAKQAGVDEAALAPTEDAIREALGPSLDAYRSHTRASFS